LIRNESNAPPWFVSSMEPKHPPHARPLNESGETSTPAEAPVNVTVKPVEPAPVTVAVPGNPAMPLIAVVRFALEYWSPPLPMRTESLPP
jgi:hypothetical protein